MASNEFGYGKAIRFMAMIDTVVQSSIFSGTRLSVKRKDVSILVVIIVIVLA